MVKGENRLYRGRGEVGGRWMKEASKEGLGTVVELLTKDCHISGKSGRLSLLCDVDTVGEGGHHCWMGLTDILRRSPVLCSS